MRRKHPRRASQPNHFWQSYSDLMAALLLAFILILSGTMLKSQLDYEESRYQLEDAWATIDAQNEEIKQVLGIRQSIIDALMDQFSGGDISIDPQTGSITFHENVLFPKNAMYLKESDKAMLRDFIPRYFNILLSEDFIDYVGEISVIGHTDTKGSYEYNLNLSLERAKNVTLFITDGDPRNGEAPILSEKQLELLIPLLTTNGRSWSEPIYYPDTTTVNMGASRRVEIQFRLKDEELIKLLEKAVS